MLKNTINSGEKDLYILEIIESPPLVTVLDLLGSEIIIIDILGDTRGIMTEERYVLRIGQNAFSPETPVFRALTCLMIFQWFVWSLVEMTSHKQLIFAIGLPPDASTIGKYALH